MSSDCYAKQSLIVCPSIPNNSHIDQKLVTRTECLNFVCKPQMMDHENKSITNCCLCH